MICTTMACGSSVFVSYSGRRPADKDFAVRLLARLGQQGLSPWIFERRGQEIAPGEEIEAACRQKIRQADIFVCVISDSSLNSQATRMEVAYALTVLRPQEIVQVATTASCSSGWCEPYSALQSYKRIDASAMRDLDLERFIQDLCSKAGIEYAAPDSGAPRLPLVRRLTQEIRAARSTDAAYEAGGFADLTTIAVEAARAYGDRRLEHACSALDAIEYQLGRLYAGQSFYYPRLVKAVLLIELAATRPVYLAQAGELLEQMHRDAGLAGKVDENLFAAMAVIALGQGEAGQALQLYGRAHRIVQARGEVDADILHNLVVAAIAHDAPVEWADVDVLLDRAGQGGATSDPMLVERIQALRAAVSARRGDVEGARRQLRGLSSASDLCADVICRVAQELAASPSVVASATAARDVETLFELALTQASAQQRTPVLLSQAGFAYRRGSFQEALRHLQAIEVTAVNSPRIAVESAWVLHRMGRPDDALHRLREAAGSSFPSTRPMAEAELLDFFYYRGFAAWLTGLADQADRDFLDSRYPASRAYRKIAASHLGLPAVQRIRAWLPGAIRFLH